VSRAVYRFRNYSIEPDLSPGAEPVEFTMRCAECEATGPAAGTSDAAAAWIVVHLKAQPRHLRYRELITRPYRAVPGGWQ
jgi:hypothetical protein